MKVLLLLFTSFLIASVSLAQPAPQRVHFKLKNNLGYHRMFRVEGPGIAYGFTMNRAETVEKSWPIGAKFYYTTDGETTKGLIFTVDESFAGRVIPIHSTEKKSTHPNEEISVRFRNNSFWFRKVAFVTYAPGETRNGTSILKIFPFGTISRRYPIGTRVYVADDTQVRTVMKGQQLSGTPFITVRAEDDGRTFPLVK